MKIETKRMTLIPMTLDFVLDKMAGKESTIEKQGVKIDKESWKKSQVIDILPELKYNLMRNAEPDGYDAWLYILRESNTVIGSGGFKGAPDENRTIDIGYEIYEEYRGNGYATEAARALIEWARKEGESIRITAGCDIGNIASAKVLRKACFKEVRRDDRSIYWELEQ